VVYRNSLLKMTERAVLGSLGSLRGLAGKEEVAEGSGGH
jgi:hypothetical protein